MADNFFDYTKVSQADDPEPFSMTDLLQSMSKMEPEDANFVGAFIGEPGTRKTTNAMKLAQAITPPDKKILYIFTGKGWTSLMNFPKLMSRTIKMPFIRNEQIETLRAALLNAEIREKLNIGAIVFDEYNRMQDMDTDILTKHRATLVNNGPTVYKDGVKVYKDPDTPEWPEYNTTKVRLINLINDLLVVPDIHTFFICHVKQEKKTGRIVPDFPQAAGSAFISMVHSIYTCMKEEAVTPDGRTVMQFPIELVGQMQTISKNRIGGLPDKIYNVEEIVTAYENWGVIPEDKEMPVVKPVAQVETLQENPVQAVATEALSIPDDILADMMGD